MDNCCSIYKITCTINNKSYIGQSWQTIEVRWKRHCKPSNRCIKLANAIKKYGKEYFNISFLTITHTQEQANYWESYFINIFDSMNCGYNLTTGGANGKLSPETRRKVSESNKGKPKSEEHIKNIILSRSHLPLSEEHKLKISEANKGRIFSDEHKEKISLARSGQAIGPMSEDHKIKISDANKGRIVSKETGQKISDALKGKSLSEEHKKNISFARKGKPKTQEFRANLSAATKGKPHKLFKLTEDDLVDIKSDPRSSRVLAKIYNVCHETIRKIRSGKYAPRKIPND